MLALIIFIVHINTTVVILIIMLTTVLGMLDHHIGNY